MPCFFPFNRLPLLHWSYLCYRCLFAKIKKRKLNQIQFSFLLQTSSDGNQTTSTLSITLSRADAGKYLSCKAYNHMSPSDALEDGWRLDIQCKWIMEKFFFITWFRDLVSILGLMSMKRVLDHRDTRMCNFDKVESNSLSSAKHMSHRLFELISAKTLFICAESF